MPSKRLTFNDFNQRLWLSGGRDQIPQNALRRAVGVAPELTRSVQSRWGSQTLWKINAISTYRFANRRYAYDGATLFQDGVPLLGGFTGGRLTFVEMPPQEGLADYLFVLGGGQLIKIDQLGNVTNWGIQPPPFGMTTSLGAQDVVVLDNFDASAGSWTAANCTISNDSSDPYEGTGSLKVAVSAQGPWKITKTGLSLDLSQYADGVISLPTDVISLYGQFKKPDKVVWLWILFDIDDGTFKKNYYRLTVQLVPSTTNKHAAGAQEIVIPGGGQWIQIAAAKSEFQRIGTDLTKDWFAVNAIRIEGGDPGADTTSMLFDIFTLYGGYPLGAGPSAIAPNNGSKYQYAVTFGSNVTGSDSNPQGMVTLADGDIAPFTPQPINGVAVQPVNLARIPVSSDAQVGNRKLWRTTANGALFSYLDTINDNTTTVYTDKKGDLPGQPVITFPWIKNATIGANRYVDGGNGYYFFTTAGGTTGATIPQWNIPNGPFLGDWLAATDYDNGDWVNYLGTGYLSIQNDNKGNVPSTSPLSWQVLGTTTDNTVTWVWKGVNEVPHLGIQSLLFDNAPPQLTYGDVAGPWEGSLFWTRDSNTKRSGWIYGSPPGRPESVGASFIISPNDDQMQKVVVFDYALWAISKRSAWALQGSYPAIIGQPIKGTPGTTQPFAVVASAQHGIFYQSSDGIRLIDRSGSLLPGFQALATIERAQGEENVVPFTAVIGSIARGEIIWSDGNVGFGLSMIGDEFVWRMLGVGLTAIFYEKDTNEILAALEGVTVLYEHPATFLEGTTGGCFTVRVTQATLEVLMTNAAGLLPESFDDDPQIPDDWITQDQSQSPT